MRIEFGSYAQVFEDNTPSNTTRARTLGVIALNPTGNAQGDFYFMSLATGARISRHSWTELPTTDTAIARVEAIAFNDEQPLIQARGLVVEWRHDQPIDATFKGNLWLCQIRLTEVPDVQWYTEGNGFHHQPI
jgi:hypothetical protein